jgi:sugar phosphate isomerase/epimerase
MYVSLNGSLTRQMPWPDFVRLAGRLGYGGVDVNLGAARKDGVEATRALLADAKVRPAITSLPLQFAAPDDAAFQKGMEGLEEAAAFTAAIGLPRMMAVLSPGSPVPRAERYPFIRDRLRAIAPVLQRSGIRLGLEFLGPLHFRTPSERSPHQFIWTLPETVALAKDVGPNIGVVLDIWHWHHSKGTVDEIVAAGKDRIVHVHLSDARDEPPEAVRDNARLMPGEGVIDARGFFRGLTAIGYEDAISPEPIGRVPADMPPEEGARLGLETTLAVMKRAGVF